MSEELEHEEMIEDYLETLDGVTAATKKRHETTARAFLGWIEESDSHVLLEVDS